MCIEPQPNKVHRTIPAIFPSELLWEHMQGLHMGPGLDLPTMVDVMLCTRNMTNDLGVIPLLKGVQELGQEVLSVG